MRKPLPQWRLETLETKMEGLKYYQTIKIRYKFKQIQMSKGYPVRAHSSLAFYGGMALWLPMGWHISEYYTYRLWEKNPEQQWRYVSIIPHAIEDDNLNQFQTALNFIPFVGGMVNSILDESVADMRRQNYPVFDNFGFYNTMADIIIEKNWDFCVEYINAFDAKRFPDEYYTPPDFDWTAVGGMPFV